MLWNFAFFFNSILLGIGLAMDAFSVSLANGLGEPKMRFPKISLIAGMFSFFQALMPMLGWVCVHSLAEHFAVFQKIVPYISLFLLLFIGGKMIYETLRHPECDECSSLGLGALILQGVATSIDALSVGFTISDYTFTFALICALIIALVTFIICFAGVLLGKKFGTALAGKAQIFGGVILIFIGIEIFLKSIINF